MTGRGSLTCYSASLGMTGRQLHQRLTNLCCGFGWPLCHTERDAAFCLVRRVASAVESSVSYTAPRRIPYEKPDSNQVIFIPRQRLSPGFHRPERGGGCRVL